MHGRNLNVWFDFTSAILFRFCAVWIKFKLSLMDLLRELAEFKGCLTRIKFDRLNFMGARANSIRLSIKRPRHDVGRFAHLTAR